MKGKEDAESYSKSGGGQILFIWQRVRLPDGVSTDVIPDAAAGKNNHGAATPKGITHRYSHYSVKRVHSVLNSRKWLQAQFTYVLGHLNLSRRSCTGKYLKTSSSFLSILPYLRQIPSSFTLRDFCPST